MSEEKGDGEGMAGGVSSDVRDEKGAVFLDVE